MKRNLDATCGTCPFWHQDKDIKKGGGECRINEPKLFTFPDNVYYVWLYTKPSDWCGQHPEFWMPVENMHPCCVQSVCDQYVTGETKHVGDGHYYPEGT